MSQLLWTVQGITQVHQTWKIITNCVGQYPVPENDFFFPFSLQETETALNMFAFVGLVLHCLGGWQFPQPPPGFPIFLPTNLTRYQRILDSSRTKISSLPYKAPFFFPYLIPPPNTSVLDSATPSAPRYPGPMQVLAGLDARGVAGTLHLAGWKWPQKSLLVFCQDHSWVTPACGHSDTSRGTPLRHGAIKEC